MRKIEEMLTDEAAIEAGFQWELGEVSYQPDKNSRQKVTLGDGPHVKVVDVEKFEAEFPGVILAALNGTSIKVQCQGVTRRAFLSAKREGGRKPTDDEMRPDVLRSLRGMKSRATVVVQNVTKYVYGGVEYDTAEEAQAAEIAFLVDMGVDAATAREKVLNR